ncbi:MAG: Uncharacterized MFS-type transporter, partial [uncultured Friedmanniella sp.]
GGGLGPVGLGLGRLQRRHHLLRLRALRRPRRGRRRAARRADRQHLARHLRLRRGPARRAHRPDHRPALRRRRPPASQPGDLDRSRGGHHAGAVHGARRAGLPLRGARAAGRRRGVPGVRRGLLQRDAPAGLHPGHPRAGVRVRLVDGLLRRHLPPADLLRRLHRARRRLVRGDVGGRAEHPRRRRLLGGLVRAVRAARAVRRARAAARSAQPPGIRAAVLPAAGRRRAAAVRARPQRRLVPARLGALPRRPGRGLHLRRHPRRQRLRPRPVDRARLRGGRERRRRPRRAGPGRGRGPGRAEEGHHGLAGGAARVLHGAALRLRPDDVLDLRAAAVPVGRSGPGQLPLVPGPGGAARPRGRDVRAVRDDRTCGVLPRAGTVRPVLRVVLGPGGYRRDRAGPAGRGDRPLQGRPAPADDAPSRPRTGM